VEVRRGDVCWALLEPRSGSEQRGRRPVVVVSHDAFNEKEAWRSIIVVPCSTSARQSQRGPTVVPIPRRTAGMPKASLALCHQVTTLDRSKLVARIGTLPNDFVVQIRRGLVVALSL